MNKIISMILLCALLLACFSGCSTPKAPADMNDPNDEVDPIPDDDKSEENPDDESKDYEMELNSFFAKLQKDAEELEKIDFFIEYQDLHYELKKSGEYDNDLWWNPTIRITIDCDYDLATDEDWYKACSNTDIKTLNTALFNEYSNELTEGHFSPWAIAPALYFEYDHSEDSLSEILAVFYSDYDVLKHLVDLKYVTGIHVGYYYSVPGSYFDE